MKLVSVIVPIYKVEAYIAATVQSVLNQTYTAFELLLVDDGSPDKSLEICQQFADPRIKIICQANQGVSEARNHGIRQAQGDYIAFLDGDDLWEPEKLEKHVRHLENAPTVGVSYSYSAFIDTAGQPMGIYQLPKTKDITPTDILLRDPIGCGSNLVARREVLEAVRFHVDYNGETKECYFDLERKLPEDTECWLRMSLQSPLKFEGIPEVLTLYRMRSDGRSHNFYEKVEAVDLMLKKAERYAPEWIAQWAPIARAYHLTALSRRAINQGDGRVAVDLCHRAIACYWKILLEEPRRTVITLGAAYLLYWLPTSFFVQLKSIGFRWMSALQKKQMLQQ
jgi:glycosyltransferase involved in cell wall biosynthesis